MNGPLCIGLNAGLILFQVWVTQNFFDIKDFIYNYNLIYPTFFSWLLQFLPLVKIKI